MQIVLFVLALILFIGLVLVHEWGHFFVARRNGVDVEEFGLGFPPRAYKKRLKSGMILSLNWLPLGGFVKLKGEHDSDHHKGSFGAASLETKTKVLLAGVTMNLLAALVIFTVLAWIGMPKLITPDSPAHENQFTVASDTKIIDQDVRVGTILPGSPADKAALRSSDLLLSISNGPKTLQIHTEQDIHNATQTFAGQTVKVTYKRNGQTLSQNIHLLSFADVIAGLMQNAGLKSGDDITRLVDTNLSGQGSSQSISSLQQLYTAAQDYAGDNLVVTYVQDGHTYTKDAVLNPKGYLGIEPTYVQIQRSTWSAPIVAVGFSKQLVVLTFKGLGEAVSGLGSTIAGAVSGNHVARENGQTNATSQVGGPVAIGLALWDSGSLGINFVLWLIGVISLTLALINVLPIPALDGGRVFMIWVSRGIFRRPLSQLAEERLVGASMLILLGLIALITLVDVKRYL